MSELASRTVFCVGLALQDTILSLEEIPGRPVKIYAQARREVGGGPAGTAAVTVARLGASAAIAARIGADNTGAAVRREFEAEGVDTRFLKSFDGFQTAGSVVLVDARGERMIVAYADPAMPAGSDWLAPASWGGAVLADLTWPAGALKALAGAREAGIPAVLDADISRHPAATVHEIVAAGDHVVFSRPGLAQLAGTDDIAAGLARVSGPRHSFVSVTDGAAGIYWLEGGIVRNMPPPAVNAVDTTGAGDAFHGAFALALAHGRPVLAAAEFANAVAALKCMRPGGRAGLPDRTALANFLPMLDLTWMDTA